MLFLLNYTYIFVIQTNRLYGIMDETQLNKKASNPMRIFTHAKISTTH